MRKIIESMQPSREILENKNRRETGKKRGEIQVWMNLLLQITVKKKVKFVLQIRKEI